MATTVNSAFSEFMKDIVNLNPDIVSAARASRDNLLENIAEFDNQTDFSTYMTGLMFILGLLQEKQNVESWMILI